MKKTFSLVLSCILLASSITIACGYNADAINKKNANLTDYSITAELTPDKKVLSGVEKISYINSEKVTLKDIYFHLYPNAFKKKDTAPFLFDSFNRAYPEGFKPGSIDIISIITQNKKLKYTISGSDSSILRLTLLKPLKPNEKIALNITFKVNIPPAGERFGYTGSCFNMGNWYPIASVYDNTGWNLDPYYALGDPFYSDAANYNVALTVPKQYTVAATGEATSEVVSGNKKTYNFKETSVRDFAFIANDKLKEAEETYAGVKIRSYYYPQNESKGKLALTVAKNSIAAYDKFYGAYPNKTYSVVETVFPSGMEYPGIVFISDNYYQLLYPTSRLETVIAHETAHQWWYGAIGNNEIDEAWLDESFACFSESIYYRYIDGEDAENGYFSNNIQYSFSRMESTLNGNEVILRTLSKFNSWNDYGQLVYNKGAIMLNTLRQQVGDTTFFNIMKTYYNTFEYKNVTTKDFINTVNKVTNKNYTTFFNKWLLGK